MYKKIKILHIISDTNIGGAGKLLVNLSSKIDKSKFEITFMLPFKSKLRGSLNKYGEIFYYKGYGDKSLEISSIISIYKIIKLVEPDIIHTHSAFNAKIAAFLCRFPKKRLIYTKHCVFERPKYKKSKIFKLLNGMIDNILSGKVIAVAEAAKDELVDTGIDSKKINVIINGADQLRISSDESREELKKKLGIKKNDFVVGISARLEKYKDHKTFIKVASEAKKNNENMVFLILGDGSYRSELEKYTKAMNVDDRVLFLGFIKDVSDYINLFDVNVNCSIGTETSSLAISEGLSIGIPAIVSDFGGNPNMVVDGETGYIFHAQDSCQLYKILLNIKNNPKLYAALRENAREDYKKRFTLERMCKEYQNIYLSMMQ